MAEPERVESVSELAELLANGYPPTTASSQGFTGESPYDEGGWEGPARMTPEQRDGIAKAIADSIDLSKWEKMLNGPTLPRPPDTLSPGFNIVRSEGERALLFYGAASGRTPLEDEFYKLSQEMSAYGLVGFRDSVPYWDENRFVVTISDHAMRQWVPAPDGIALPAFVRNIVDGMFKVAMTLGPAPPQPTAEWTKFGRFPNLSWRLVSQPEWVEGETFVVLELSIDAKPETLEAFNRLPTEFDRERQGWQVGLKRVSASWVQARSARYDLNPENEPDEFALVEEIAKHWNGNRWTGNGGWESLLRPDGRPCVAEVKRRIALWDGIDVRIHEIKAEPLSASGLEGYQEFAARARSHFSRPRLPNVYTPLYRKEEDFQKAIEASPGDFGLRLVYADWLRETYDQKRTDWARAQTFMGRFEVIPWRTQCGIWRWRDSDFFSGTEVKTWVVGRAIELLIDRGTRRSPVQRDDLGRNLGRNLFVPFVLRDNYATRFGAEDLLSRALATLADAISG